MLAKFGKFWYHIVMSMTRRERLMTVLAGQTPDRVPINLYELNDNGQNPWNMTEPSYKKLMDVILTKTEWMPFWGPGVKSATYKPTIVKNYDEGEFHVTVQTIPTPLGDLTTTTKYRDDIMTTWTTEPLLKNVEDVKKYLSLPSEIESVDASSHKVLDAYIGDRGVTLCDTPDPICALASLFEMGEFTMFVLEEPELAREICEREFKRIMHILDESLKQGSGPIYRIYGPEYATPPYLPPRAFREFVFPYIKEMAALMHSNGVYCRVHSHGNIAQVLDMIVEAGVDAIDPAEDRPDGDISMREIKEKYPNLVVFGNMQLKYLEQESESEIADRVKYMMDEAKEGGHYVLLPTAAPINIPLASVTERNYITMIETALEEGKY